MKYTTLLFDADGTILDFDKSEAEALEKTFTFFGLPFNQDVLSLYHDNNVKYWKMFEKSQISKPQVLILRFSDTLMTLGCDVDVEAVARHFQGLLSCGYHMLDGAMQLLMQLSATHQLYCVTNGVKDTQRQRMAGSGLDKVFIECFISEEVGYAKPDKRYFDYCLSRIREKDLSKILVIGDSLSSDILGGVNAGLDTCWFNPERKANFTDLCPTYEISSLEQLYKIV